MKIRISMILILCSIFLVSSIPLDAQQDLRPFGSAVETYVTVQFMITKHPTPDMLASRIVHWLAVDQFTIQDVYELVGSESYGEIPEILKPYYE